MKKVLKQFVIQFSPQLCSFAMMVAAIAVSGCKRNFYQPREPDGLAEFAEKLSR